MGRPAPELRLFELPVLHPELLGVVDRPVRRHRLGTPHDVDRVHEELAGDARLLCVGAEAPHPDAREEHDDRVVAAHRWRLARRVGVVVRGVVDPILLVQLVQPIDARLERDARRQVEQQRADLRGEEVIRARGARGRESRGVLTAQEVEDRRRVVEVPDDQPRPARDATRDDTEPRGLATPLIVGERRERRHHGTEGVVATVYHQECFSALHEVKRRCFALLARRAPADDTVTTEHHTVCRGVPGDEVAQLQTEVEARTLPVEPPDVASVARLDEALAIGGGRQRDHRVGMGVVDV